MNKSLTMVWEIERCKKRIAKAHRRLKRYDMAADEVKINHELDTIERLQKRLGEIGA